MILHVTNFLKVVTKRSFNISHYKNKVGGGLIIGVNIETLKFLGRYSLTNTLLVRGTVNKGGRSPTNESIEMRFWYLE